MKKGELTKTILATLAGGAIVVAAVSLPGAAAALAPFLKRKPDRERKSLERAIRRLRERGAISFVARKGKVYFSITEEGKRRLKSFELNDLTLETPKSWDGYWSAILFDIPESKRRGRDALREKLRQLHCFQYHKSVFVHPAPCEDEVDFIAETFGIRQFVTVFRTKSLGHQEHRAYRFFSLTPKQ